MSDVSQIAPHSAIQWDAVVSHQLKTPLCAMQADLMRTNNVDPRQMLLDVQRMIRLIDQLHLASRCRSGQVKMKPGNLEDAAKSVCRRLAPLALARGQQFCFRRFGRAQGPLMVMMDRVLAEEVICNLVENAIKYAPDNSQIVVVVTSQGQVHVMDSGPGVPKADRKRIFESFHRSAATSHLPGSGLGLSLASSIMSMHRGTIRHDPRKGRGSVFTLGFRLEGRTQPVNARETVPAHMAVPSAQTYPRLVDQTVGSQLKPQASL